MQLEIITKQELENFKVDLGRLIEQELLKAGLSQQINHCITTKEACKLLNVTPKTLQSYRDRKLISFSQIGSKILFTKQDIADFLENFKIKSRVNLKSK